MSVLNFATSPNSGVKLLGGFLRSEKTIFRFISSGGASFSWYFVFLLLRSRDEFGASLGWNEESDRAFEGMKQALLFAVGLHLVDPDRGFVLRTDASDYAVGTVLEQVLDDGRHVPVAF